MPAHLAELLFADLLEDVGQGLVVRLGEAGRLLAARVGGRLGDARTLLPQTWSGNLLVVVMGIVWE